MPKHVVDILVLGSPGTGKTSLIHKYVYGKFLDDSKPTLVHDLVCKKLIQNINTSQFLICRFWDTSGTYASRRFRKPLFKKTRAIVLCIDLSDLYSIQTVKCYIKEIMENADPDCSLIVLGTKADKTDRLLGTELLTKYFSRRLIPYFDISTMTNYNVSRVMDYIIFNAYKHKKSVGEKKEKERRLKKRLFQRNNSKDGFLNWLLCK